ncbi:hypothetical protein ACLB2K_050935 [Fragaria x ananassa]
MGFGGTSLQTLKLAALPSPSSSSSFRSAVKPLSKTFLYRNSHTPRPQLPLFFVKSFSASAVHATAPTAPKVTSPVEKGVKPQWKAAIDFKWIRENKDDVAANIKKRNSNANLELVLELYNQMLNLQKLIVTHRKQEVEQLRAERNAVANKMKGKLESSERQKLIEEGKNLKEALLTLEEDLLKLTDELQQEAQCIPNMTHPDVPIGGEDNSTIRKMVGRPREFNFPVKDHLQLGKDLDLFDFDAASEVSGSKFYYLKNEAVMLEMGLINWTLLEVMKWGFTALTTPEIVRSSVVEKCGFQPRGTNTQVYSIEGSDQCLIGTAEIPVGGIHMDSILSASVLPLKYVAVSHCFRTEAGAAGTATRGLYRVHQFSKLEMFILCQPEESNFYHEELIKIEEDLFSSLGLHYKTLDMASGDLGAPAYRKFDIEAWMPGLARFGEEVKQQFCEDLSNSILLENLIDCGSMASTSGVSSSVIPEVLNRNNYKTWRSRIETYLLAEDLWEVVEATREPAGNLEDDEPEYKAWKRKNAKALYAIQNSCGQEMFQFISETKTAKFAWETLEKVSILGGRVENSAEYFEPYVQFTEFVREGDWDKAKECLKLKNLDLHSAVRAIDPRDKFGDTAVHVAARQGHVNIVKELMLLMTHEDLKMGNARGDTALHVAAANGQLQTVKELVLLMGEKRNNEGDTALHLAVQWEEVDVVKELVSFMRQTDLNIKNNNGDTALHLAVKKRNVAMMKYLAALIGEVRVPDGDTALHLAVKLGAAKVVKELVALMKEEDLAIKNDEGYTAHHLAVKKGIVPVVKELMTKEKERDFDSYIEFTTNVIKGEWDNAKECLTKLDEPCDAITIVDPRDGYGDTALHSAAKQGHVHIVKELISLLKVRPEIQKLQTIEDIAAFGSGINLGVTEEVVRKNAKYMVEQYEKLLTSILEVQNTQGSTALHIAASNGNLDIVKELMPLMRKEGLEIQDAAGITALLNAVDKGNIEIVKELLPVMRQEGLELKTDKHGCNALHLAIIWNGHMNIAKEVMPFMRKEALEKKDGAGYTALGCALAARRDGDVMEIAKYMAENNTKVFGVRVPGSNWIPVVRALDDSRWDLCRRLYPLTPLEYLMPEHGTDGAQLIKRKIGRPVSSKNRPREEDIPPWKLKVNQDKKCIQGVKHTLELEGTPDMQTNQDKVATADPEATSSA